MVSYYFPIDRDFVDWMMDAERGKDVSYNEVCPKLNVPEVGG